jgi:hypothetical protein
VSEVIEEVGQEIPWLIGDLLARGAVTDFSGLAKKGGKTTFWCHAIAAGARGIKHAGLSTEAAKYLYLTEQGDNIALALQDAGLEEHEEYVRIVHFRDVASVAWERLVGLAAEETVRLGFDALVVDTFAVFARLKGSEENDSGPVGDRMRALTLAAQKHNIAVVLIRHAGKDGTPRGSSAFEGVADLCVTISRPEGHHAKNIRKLSGIGRYGEWERNVELDSDERCYVSHGSDNRVEFQKAVAFVKTVLPESPAAGIKKSQILDGREGVDAEISSTTLARALSWLVEEGAVGEKQLLNRRGRPKVYWLVTRKRKPAGRGPGEDPKVYLNQTPSLTNSNGLNKPKGDSGAPEGAPEGAPKRGRYDKWVVEYADMSWIKPSVDIPSSSGSGTESGEVAAGASPVASPGATDPATDPAPYEGREDALSPLADALHAYLWKNPHDARQEPSWLGGTLWAHGLTPSGSKPTPDEVLAALEELGGSVYLQSLLEDA